MKVIFLDCDGVLVNSRSLAWDKQSEIVDPELICDPLGKITPLETCCVEQLSRIVKETNASGVVLTTMWRHYPDRRSFLVSALTSRNIPVVGDTPGGAGRANEIQTWLQHHDPLQSFVILDDQHRALFQKENLDNHLVQTRGRSDQNDTTREGLTVEKADEAIAILNQTASEKSHADCWDNGCS